MHPTTHHSLFLFLFLFVIKSFGQSTCPDGPQVELGRDTLLCGGQALLLKAGDNPNYFYQWAPGNESTRSIIVKESGTYSVTVTDTVANCQVTDKITVTVKPTPKVLNTVVTKPTQCNTADGAITLETDGNYDYEWRNQDEVLISSNKDLVNLPVGVYRFKASVPDGCSYSFTTALNSSNPAFTIPKPTITYESCLENDGSVIINPKPVNSNYTYKWSKQEDKTFSASSNAITGLKGGLYDVLVTDENNCLYANANINVKTIRFTFDLGEAQVGCNAESHAITNAPAGYVAYNWKTDRGSFSSPTDQKDVTVTGFGRYTVAITNDLGCVAKDSIYVVFRKTKVNIGADQVSCSETGTVVLKSDQEYPKGYLFIWSKDGTYLKTTYKNEFEVTESGEYVLKVQDNQVDCSATDTVKIIFSTPMVNSLNDTVLCEGTSVTLDAGNPGSFYAWNNGATSETIDVNAAGNYSVKLTNKAGCDETFSANVSVFSSTVLESLSDTFKTCLETTEGRPLDFSKYTESEFNWYKGSEFQSSGNTFKPVSEGAYTLVVKDLQSGCNNSKDFYTQNDCLGVIYIPTAFSPNGDSNNDLLTIFGNTDKVDNFQFRIYNGWGELIMVKNSPLDVWDGYAFGKEVPVGNYAYIISYRSSSNGENKEIVQRGNVTVVR